MNKISFQTSHAFYIVGMAFYWTVPRRSYFQYLFSLADSSSVDQHLLYAFYLFGIVLLALVAVFLNNGVLQAISRRKTWTAVLAAAGTLGGLCIYVSPNAGSVGPFLAIGGIIGCAASFVCLTFAWGFEALKLPGKKMLLYSVVAFLFSFVLLTTSSLPDPIPAFLPVSAPLISGLCWFMAARYRAKDIPLRFSTESFLASLNKAPLGMIAVLVLALLVGGTIRGFIYPGTFSDEPVLGPIEINTVSVLFSVILCLAIFVSTHREKLLYSIWIGLIVVFLAGLLFMSALNSEWGVYGRAIIIIARSYLSFFLWIALLGSVQTTRTSPVVLLGSFFLIPEVIAWLLSYFAVPSFVSVTQATFDENAGLFSIIGSLLIVIASLIFLRNKAFDADGKPGYEFEDDVRKRTVQQLGKDYGLTDRETEIMLFVSQGNSAKKIADMAYLSTGTVQTHIKKIYQKLEIHTKQELIDLVSEGMLHHSRK